MNNQNLTSRSEPLPNGGYVRTYSDGNKYWYDKDGKLHRDDGPTAVFRDVGSVYWYIHGRNVTEDEYNEWKAVQDLLKKASETAGINLDI